MLEQLLLDLVNAGLRPSIKTHLLRLPDTDEWAAENEQGWFRVDPEHVFGWVIDAWATTDNGKSIIGATCPTIKSAIEYTRKEMEKYNIA